MLRPRYGHSLPKELQPAGAFQAGQRLAGGVAAPEFAKLLSTIDGGAPVHAGNTVELYFSGTRAMDAMVQAIATAKREVLVESYIFRDDQTGYRFQRELRAAAQRGVVVRVLADAFGSLRTHGHFWRELQGSGADVRLYNRPFSYLWWQPFRDHRKILVSDRTIAFTGGMNIADEYGSSTRPRKRVWRDTHLQVIGPTALEMAAVFSEGWERAGGGPLYVETQPAAHLDQGADILVQDAIRGRGHHEMASVLAAILGASRQRVWLTTAYFVPGRRGIRALQATARRGLDVRLLVPGRSDVRVTRHAAHAHYRPLLEAGVRVFEYQDAILHAKTLVADGRVAIVGSANMDLRSYRFNAECNLVILNARVAESLEAQFIDDMRHSEEIQLAKWRTRGVGHRLLDAAAYALGPLL